MYRVTNISLVKVFEKYKVANLDELDNQSLIKFCNDPLVRISPQYLRDEITRKPIKFSRFDTIDYIIDQFSISFYMGREYWDIRHVEQAEDRGLDNKLNKFTTGDKTVQQFADLKWGVSKLKPGESADLDLSDRFVDEILHYEHTIAGVRASRTATEVGPDIVEKSPYFESLKIVNLDEGKSDEDRQPVVDISKMTFREKQAYATDLNKKFREQGKETIKAFGVKEDELTQSLIALNGKSDNNVE